MTLKSMQSLNSQNIFFEKFKKRSFLEKIARWAKYLSYGFLIITAATMVVQLLLPFGNDVPDLFMQLLFLLIFWGTVEILTLPLEYIHDHYIFDFEKNWLALSQQRFFYRRVTIIAAFNQIKAIGVSAQPHALTSKIHGSSGDHFAIFVQTLKNELIQVSDYELSLQEADAFCHRLYSSHFSGAAYIGGAPGMEICVDPETGELSTRPAQKDFSNLVDILSIPALQAVLAFLITYSVMNLSLSIIQKTSKEFFAADLKIRHQPVFQFIVGVAEKDTSLAVKTDPVASSTISLTLPASAPVSIDLTRQQVLVAQPGERSENNSNQGETTQNQVVATMALAIPESEPEQLKPNPVAVNKDTQPNPPGQNVAGKENAEIEPAPATLAITEKETKKAATSPFHALANQLAAATSQETCRNQPLQAKIPDIDPNCLKNARLKNTSIPTMHSSGVGNETLPLIIPGCGIHPFFQLGDNLDKVISHFGKPLASHRSDNEIQYVFQGFSVITTPQKDGKIMKIIVSNNIGSYPGKTQQGFGIGSDFAEVKQLGPYALLKNEPGFHFSNLGITFIPAHNAPEKVGTIQIYPATY